MNSIERQWIAAKAFIVNDGKVLVLREAETDVASVVGTYQLPGGRLQMGESFFDALSREVQEETSLAIEAVRPLTVSQWTPVVQNQRWQVVGFFYECKITSGSVQLSEEHDDYKWISPNEYAQLEISPGERPVFEAYLSLQGSSHE